MLLRTTKIVSHSSINSISFYMIRILGRGSNLEYLNLLSDPSLYLLSYIACLTSVFSTKQNKPGITNNERERLEHYSYKTRPWLTSSASFQFPQGWDYRSEKTRHLWEAETMYKLKGQQNMWTGQGFKYGLVHPAGLSCRPVLLIRLADPSSWFVLLAYWTIHIIKFKVRMFQSAYMF